MSGENEVVSKARHEAGVDNNLADLIALCEPSMIDEDLKCRRPDVNWCEHVLGREKEKCSAILRGVTRSVVLRCGLEVFTQELEGSRCWIEATSSECEAVDELAEYMAYCCATWKTRETTVAGKLFAGNVFHELWVGRSLSLNHFRIKAAKEWGVGGRVAWIR